MELDSPMDISISCSNSISENGEQEVGSVSSSLSLLSVEAPMPDELDITTVSPLLIVLDVCAVCVECLTFGDLYFLV